MRVVEVNGHKFEVRGLRLSEVSSTKMRKLGYGRFLFQPNLNGAEDQQDRMAQIMDAALDAVLGAEGCRRVDLAGGVSGLHQVFRAIIAETYGGPGEEKNSSSAGSGCPTPSAETIATPVSGASAATDATTENSPS